MNYENMKKYVSVTRMLFFSMSLLITQIGVRLPCSNLPTFNSHHGTHTLCSVSYAGFALLSVVGLSA